MLPSRTAVHALRRGPLFADDHTAAGLTYVVELRATAGPATRSERSHVRRDLSEHLPSFLSPPCVDTMKSGRRLPRSFGLPERPLAEGYSLLEDPAVSGSRSSGFSILPIDLQRSPVFFFTRVSSAPASTASISSVHLSTGLVSSA